MLNQSLKGTEALLYSRIKGFIGAKKKRKEKKEEKTGLAQ
jgi:hypothetical protein